MGNSAAIVLRALWVAMAVAAGSWTAVGAEAVPPGEGLTNPTLAFNLQGVSYYSSERPFIDLMHSAREWFGSSKSTFQTADPEQLRQVGTFDDNGWPTSIPKLNGTQEIRTTWDGVAIEHNTAYVLTYRGDGKLRLDAPGGRVNILDAKVGRVEFTVSGAQAMLMLSITSTDLHRTGDYLRDISIVPRKYEALARAGEIFNPDWLAIVNDARQLRFMDWMQTNNSSQAEWAQRPRVSDYSWGWRGVPLEVMVQLANQTGAEPWFTMPAMASDDYVTQFASYVRDHLDPELPVHAEWSNEPWNLGFAQTNWARQQAQALWGNDAEEHDYQAMRATQVAAIWDGVFGSDAKRRVDNVLGLQTGNAASVQNLLKASKWRASDPGHFIEPASVIDSVGVTTYFGYQVLGDGGQRERLIEAIKSMSFNDAADWLAFQLTSPQYPTSVPMIAATWAAVSDAARDFGIRMVAYEGGQHILYFGWDRSALSDADVAEVNDWLARFVRSPQMAGLYKLLWDDWAALAQGPFMQFVDVGGASQYGAWGLYDHLGDTNPRAEFLKQMNESAPGWFGDGGGPRYQQGVIRIAQGSGETLTGTDKQDFLIGGDGADTFVPGLGDDTISGGDGKDEVIVDGSAADYRVTKDPKGFMLTGPSGSKLLIDVETIAFEDGEGAAQALGSLVR